MAEDHFSSAPSAPSAAATAAAAAAAAVGSSVIPIVNKLQDIFAQLGSSSTIDLPQVAVVGSQSSGKSSVLEALVGRDFLPRGSDICTRRPLVLQLVHQPRRPADAEADEWGEFLHLSGRRFYDFREIRREIQAETDREAGGNKGVSDRQIRLKIFSPNVLNITLVDLPGITKVPVGDQPTDIEARIRTMIMSYIKHKTCIILAVSPANADLANSDALQMARVADPDGSRTIGVITKLDIMDRGTDARNFLLGNVIPLKLGYVGVVNRSQQDINSDLSIKDALAREEKFFRTQPAYHGLAQYCGIPQLAKKLNQILVQHIKTVLPGLKSRISSQLTAVAKELAVYGDPVDSKAGQGAKLLNILAKYCEAFSSMVEGKNEDIRMAIQNATGPRSALFVPEVPFEVLVRRQISRLLDPSLQCAQFIYDELVKMSHRCLATELQQFPILRRSMDEVIGKFLRDGLKPAESMISHIIEMEEDYINTSHPSFIGGSKAVEEAQQQVRSAKTSAVVVRKDGVDSQVSEKTQKSRPILGRSGVNGVVTDHIQGVRPAAEAERPGSSGSGSTSFWNQIFTSNEDRTHAPARDNTANKSYAMPAPNLDHSFSTIQLREPPVVLKPSEHQSEQEALEIAITKLLLKSYYNIVRKNVEDFIPKAIMHFLVNHTKRALHNYLITKLYRDDLLEDLLKEPDELTIKRKQIRENLKVLQQAYKTLDEIPLDAEAVERGGGYSLDSDAIGLPRAHGLSSSLHGFNDGSSSYSTPKQSRSRRPNHSGEQLPFNPATSGNGF
ncbi:Dynamin-related protein 3A [Zea mays]|uniref:Dynamin-related protein 3A n=1 Tax=Zea mays TaxID=4577 RepID=A0A1D6G5W6_MAIZE|nr:Dynamin-related protein 3A [Zea mays]